VVRKIFYLGQRGTQNISYVLTKNYQAFAPIRNIQFVWGLSHILIIEYKRTFGGEATIRGGKWSGRKWGGAPALGDFWDLLPK